MIVFLQREMLELLHTECGCFCMSQSDFVGPILSDITEQSEDNQHIIISSITSILLNQLAGNSCSLI